MPVLLPGHTSESESQAQEMQGWRSLGRAGFLFAPCGEESVNADKAQVWSSPYAPSEGFLALFSPWHTWELAGSIRGWWEGSLLCLSHGFHLFLVNQWSYPSPVFSDSLSLITGSEEMSGQGRSQEALGRVWLFIAFSVLTQAGLWTLWASFTLVINRRSVTRLAYSQACCKDRNEIICGATCLESI